MENPSIFNKSEPDTNTVAECDKVAPPWLLDTREFMPVGDESTVQQTIDQLRTDNTLLTLPHENGNESSRSIILKCEQDGLSIDKPFDIDWLSGKGLRVFFPDSNGGWNFFKSEIQSETLYTLTVSRPDIIYKLQRRMYRRVAAPTGTTAIFSREEQTCYGGIVKDISSAGMLICTGTPHFKLEQNDRIREISISLPKYFIKSRKTGKRLKTPITVQAGRVVRSFRDHRTNRICHGVSFDGTDSHFQSILNDLSAGFPDGTNV